MKYFDWGREKNEQLKIERDISFDDVIIAMSEGCILDVLEHPQKDRYPQQKLFIIAIEGYAYLVPFVEDDEKIFLKTIIPSRKATKQYLYP